MQIGKEIIERNEKILESDLIKVLRRNIRKSQTQKGFGQTSHSNFRQYGF